MRNRAEHAHHFLCLEYHLSQKQLYVTPLTFPYIKVNVAADSMKE